MRSFQQRVPAGLFIQGRESYRDKDSPLRRGTFLAREQRLRIWCLQGVKNANMDGSRPLWYCRWSYKVLKLRSAVLEELQCHVYAGLKMIIPS